MPPKLNLIGQIFGKLTVIKEAPKKNTSIRWYCECECGKTSISSTVNLRNGGSKSCGCISRMNTIKRNKKNTKHNMTNSKFIYLWKQLQNFKDISPEWKIPKNINKNLKKWAIKNGWEKGNRYSLKKINQNKPIGPNNCKLILLTPNLTGQRFNRLFVIGKAIKHKNGILWDCICDCGNFLQVNTRPLMIGNTQSCGCLSKDNIVKRNKENAIHGLRNHPLYKIWQGIKNRCKATTGKNYKYYASKGITICSEWENNPKIFIYWALQNGWKNGLCIHRLNSDDNYSPKCCVFLTKSKHTIHHNNLRYKK